MNQPQRPEYEQYPPAICLSYDPETKQPIITLTPHDQYATPYRRDTEADYKTLRAKILKSSRKFKHLRHTKELIDALTSALDILEISISLELENALSPKSEKP